MLNLFIALIPIILFAVYKNGYIPFANNKTNVLGLIYPLIFIGLGALTSFLIEFVYYKFIKKNNQLKNSYSIFPGLFLAMILPLNTPIYILLIGSAVATLSKILSGGFGKNIFNPALVGYVFTMIIFSSIFTTVTKVSPFPSPATTLFKSPIPDAS